MDGPMAGVLDSLARYARPLLLLVASLLAIGAGLILLGMPLAGWTLYGLGYLGLLLALPAAAAVYWTALNGWSWVWFAMLCIGVLLGLPVMLMGVVGAMESATAPDLAEAVELTPLGIIAGLLTWVGLGLFGLAAYRAGALPLGGAVLFTIAAIVAVPAELGVFAAFAWAFGVILAALGLVWIAPVPAPRRSAVL
jgi:hypothetical protein